jgi:microcystin-dependent protein
VSEPFLGEIRMFAFNFNPQGWLQADGAVLPISQNTALFSLLGTQFGGDGISTFALPDLRGRVSNHQGQGPGLSEYVVGQAGGAETVTLAREQMPAHAHRLNGNSSPATTRHPGGAVLAQTTTATYAEAPNGPVLDAAAIGTTGGGQPVGVLAPYLTLNFCIAVQGIFPSRS